MVLLNNKLVIHKALQRQPTTSENSLISRHLRTATIVGEFTSQLTVQ